MPIEKSSSVEDKVLSVLRSFLNEGVAINHQSLIGRELGISGGDSIELLDELEEKIGVDLDPLVDRATFYLKPSWFDRLRGRKHGPPVADVTVGELIRFIEATATGGKPAQ